MKLKKRLMFVGILLLTYSLSAQKNSYYNQENKSKMSSLSAIVGNWKGEGWMMNRQTRARDQFKVQENIEYALDSTVIYMRGLGTDETGVVHDALGILSVNPEGDFFITSFLGDGRTGKYEMKRNGSQWEWKIPIPQGTIIYAIELEENSWKEKGFFDMNGTPYQFFEMNLVRK